MLEPLLHSLYTTSLFSVISNYPGIQRHFHAHDTHLYLSFSPELISLALSAMESCIRDVFSWMTSNKLTVNPKKTKYLLFNLRNINPPVNTSNFDSNIISLSDSSKNLGVIFQTDMSLDKHVSSIVKSCFFQLRDFQHIRLFISKTAAITLANAFVHSRLDFRNSLFYGLFKSSIHRLQKVQNAVARIVSNSSRFSHITSTFKS